MLMTTRGIVFKCTKYSETSLIVSVFTEVKGLRQYIFNGIRSKKAKTKAGLLRPMNIVELVAYDRDDKGINRVRELRMVRVYESIPFEVMKGTVGLFMIEVAQKSIRETETNVPLFNFLAESFAWLDQARVSVANLPVSYLVHLSRFIGIFPESREAGLILDEIQTEALKKFIRHDFRESHLIPVEKEVRRILLHKLIDFYRQHLEGMQVIYAHEVLREVFE